ncbi:hypothetical protein FD04_GL002356 [Secundilactobacillus odoratitofui DSM 19909 = JCM 15043]|uniref:Uncharacterized protein n=1 Tax=Secundilactobacillus odoratitofui DSM 19909 = JCM 15043 TaxID=1423776 RepID=A0A0R1M1D7_9LACO|nr:hypothetical protein [Secundilactobacillus odoratitofui]KRK99172.1 hypothetical protein FD04_GL002356 [Secundilactobacillus odoratitofui DSM 19909 = JCM 15043]
MQGNFIYINWEQVNNLVISYGITPADFVNGVADVPQRIVLIDGQLEGNQINNHTRFPTVTGQSSVRAFLLGKTQTPKKWLDFHENDDLDLLMPSEIAELLYMAHMGTHYHLPLYSKLQNKYAYLSVNDGFSKVYYRDMRTFNHVLDISLKRHLRLLHSNRWMMFNRPFSVSDVPNDILKQLETVFSDGIIMAFDQAVERRRQYLIPLRLQMHPERQNWWHDRMDVYETTRQVATLSYDVERKTWGLSIQDQAPFVENEIDL